MLKKHHLAILAFLVALVGIAATDSVNGVHNSFQPPSAVTGATGEGNCTSCHSGTVNSGGGSLSLTGLPAGGYIPGQVYTLTATVNDVSQPAATRKYGFEVTALRPTNAMAGSFALTSTTTTALATATVSGGSRSYVSHKSANSSSSWSFNWTAPATAIGTVTFYMAGNAANGTGNSSGDKIYTSSFTVAQAPAPTADFTTSTTAVCAGGSITFTNTSTGSPTSQSWNFGNGQTAATTGPHTITFATAGTFNVVLTATNAVGSTTKTVSVTVHPQPVALIQATDTTFCEGGTVNLSTTVAYPTYSWSSGSTAGSISTDSSMCVTVTVTDGNTCTATSPSFCVTEAPTPVVSIQASDTAFCEGETVTLTTTTPFVTYDWANGFLGAQFIADTTLCTYVAGTDANGCVGVSDTFCVTMLSNPAQPQLTPANPEWCAGGNDTLSFSGTYSAVLWNNQATGTSLVINQPGNYFVTVTGANGCTAQSDTVTAVEHPLPVIAISGPSTFCAGSTANLCGPALTGHALWSTGDTTLCISVSQTDTVSLAFTDTNGCTGVSAPFVVTQGISLTPTLLVDGQVAGDTTFFCAGDSLVLSAGQFATYLWSNGATSGTVVVDTTGSFNVTVNDGQGCSGSSVTLHMVENPLPVVNFSFAPGKEPVLHATAGYAQYQWFLDGNPITGGTDSTFQTTSKGDYQVCVTDANGCTACSGIQNITWTGMDPVSRMVMHVSPNPTRDRLAISLRNADIQTVSSVEILDLTGRTVQQLSPAAEMSADLSALPAGTYLLRVRLHTGTSVTALVVRS